MENVRQLLKELKRSLDPAESASELQAIEQQLSQSEGRLPKVAGNAPSRAGKPQSASGQVQSGESSASTGAGDMVLGRSGLWEYLVRLCLRTVKWVVARCRRQPSDQSYHL
jgi:hypothetical protein